MNLLEAFSGALVDINIWSCLHLQGTKSFEWVSMNSENWVARIWNPWPQKMILWFSMSRKKKKISENCGWWIWSFDKLIDIEKYEIIISDWFDISFGSLYC